MKAVHGLLLCLFLALPQTAQADETTKEDYVKAHYTKYEYRIPMRDNKKLFTSVYVPKDTTHSYPILMTRTPYSVAPYGVDVYREKLGPSDEFEKAGYIFVYQDVRGRYMSEGKFLDMTPHVKNKKSANDVDNSSDTYDTIEYLLKHVPNHNGKVGLYGTSYPGFYTSAGVIDSHPALKAASPQAPMTDLYFGDDTYHGGAFRLAQNFEFLTYFKEFKEPKRPLKNEPAFDMGTPDAYEFHLSAGSLDALNKKYLKAENVYFNDWIAHTTYDDYWKTRNIAPHLRNIKCALLTVGGWFDAEDLAGPLKTYYAIEEQNRGADNRIVMGPWVHGGWNRGDADHLGDVEFNSKTGEYFRSQIQFPFFEKYLKDKKVSLAHAYMFETGTNVWRSFAKWPPKGVKRQMLYFDKNGGLTFSAPQEKDAKDVYTSDPKHPVPFVGYVSASVLQRYMVDDQRFASKRPDVLVYQTEPLQDDVTIAGPISPRLFVTTTGTDSDFVVKLIDVYPNDYPDKVEAKEGKRVLGPPPVRMGGYQQLLRGEVMRAKFRNSWETPTPMTPGKLETIQFIMPDVNHTFRQGHRIMVQVQSSWFPLFDLNPQTFTHIPTAKPEDFVSSTQQVYRSEAAPSGIEVLVMPQP